jgi:hypothetical protein
MSDNSSQPKISFTTLSKPSAPQTATPSANQHNSLNTKNISHIREYGNKIKKMISAIVDNAINDKIDIHEAGEQLRTIYNCVKPPSLEHQQLGDNRAQPSNDSRGNVAGAVPLINPDTGVRSTPASSLDTATTPSAPDSLSQNDRLKYGGFNPTTTVDVLRGGGPSRFRSNILRRNMAGGNRSMRFALFKYRVNRFFSNN